MIKKKIDYDATEEPNLEYEGDFIVKKIIENGCWIIALEDSEKSNPKEYVIQLEGLGKKENNGLPELKINQKIRIVVKTTKKPKYT